MKNESITISTEISAPLSTIWRCWMSPDDIINWYFATPEWHCPRAENDPQSDGRFSFRMEAQDGSMGFDYAGTYQDVITHKSILYTLDDDRRVQVDFSGDETSTQIVQTFEAETTNPMDMQRAGWQAILENFKKYVEGAAV